MISPFDNQHAYSVFWFSLTSYQHSLKFSPNILNLIITSITVLVGIVEVEVVVVVVVVVVLAAVSRYCLFVSSTTPLSCSGSFSLIL